MTARLAQGASTLQIAAELEIAPDALRSDLKSIYRKLGVRSRTELLGRLQRVTQ